MREIVKDIYNEMTTGKDWDNISWLESEVDAYNNEAKETSDYKRRTDRIKSAGVANYKGTVLVEPKMEVGVYALCLQLSNLEKDLFPFTIVDYDTHVGIDALVKMRDNYDVPLKNSKLYYVEFKNILEGRFNHSFKNTHSIVCWDINSNAMTSGQEFSDLTGEKRTLRIHAPNEECNYTRYFLDSNRSNLKIEIFVLKSYLRQKLGIEFRPRDENSVI